MIRDGEFLEHAEVFGNYYGTARRFLHDAEQNGRDLLLDIDVQGAAQIQHKAPRRHQHLHPAAGPQDARRTPAQAQRRSRRRDSAAPGHGHREIENYDRYNYILVNDQLEDSIKALRAIVRGERLVRAGGRSPRRRAKTVALAERCRLANVRERLKSILDSFKPPAMLKG
jgi:guanylate kinase